MSFFQQIDSSIISKKESIVDKNLLYSDENPELYVLTDEYLNSSNVRLLKKLINKSFNSNIHICIIYVFKVETTEDNQKKNLFDFVTNYSIDLTDFIPKNSKIVSLGRSLYSITKDTGFQLSTFQDIVWNDTKFFDPITKSWVFPVCSFSKIFPEGTVLSKTYDYFHFNHQLIYAKNFEVAPIRFPKINIELIENTNEFLKTHMNEKIVSWDLETSGFDCKRDKIRCITMSFDGKNAFYLRWKDIDHKLLNEFFKGKYQIGANLKFDCRFLWSLGITNAMPDFDTLHAGHCLNEMRSNSLKTHAWIYTYHGGYDLPLELHKKNHRGIKTYFDIPEYLMIEYASKDAAVTFQVYEAMVKHLNEDPLLKDYFYDHVMPTVQMFVEIESKGVYVNWNRIEKAKEELLLKRQAIKDLITEEAGFEIDLNSSEKLAKALQYKLNFPFLGSLNKKDLYFTNEEHLKEWSKKGYKIADLILEYRSYSALLNTFIGDEKEKTAYWAYKSPDGKMYPSFGVMLANSHRNKAHSPNLQQVPHHGEKAVTIRSFYDVPSDEYRISEFDYSGLQLRIAAIMSKDKSMKKAFVELGGDLHSFTAQPIFSPELSIEEFISKRKQEPYSEYRFSAKGINFGFLFGMGHFSFASNTIRKEWSLERCKNFCREHELDLIDSVYENKKDYQLTVAKYLRDKFFETYPGLVEWHKNVHKFAFENGYIRYTHGGRRLLPQLLYTGDDKKTEANLKNISLNSPVQNFEIVMISRAMRKFFNYCKEKNRKSSIWATVHDAIIFYIHEDEIEEMSKIIPSIMEESYEEYGGIPIEVEGDISNPRDKENPTFWGYGEEYKKII